MKRRNSIETLVSRGAIIILAFLYAEAKLKDVWEAGFRVGHQQGFIQGLQQTPQARRTL